LSTFGSAVGAANYHDLYFFAVVPRRAFLGAEGTPPLGGGVQHTGSKFPAAGWKQTSYLFPAGGLFDRRTPDPLPPPSPKKGPGAGPRRPSLAGRAALHRSGRTASEGRMFRHACVWGGGELLCVGFKSMIQYDMVGLVILVCGGGTSPRIGVLVPSPSHRRRPSLRPVPSPGQLPQQY